MTIQITKNDTKNSLSSKELDSFKKEFNKKHCILLPKFIHSDLLKSIQDEIKLCKFSKRIHKGIGEELYLKNNKLIGLLFFMLNQKKLFHIIKKITGCNKIESFLGRVYKFVPRLGHFDTWHNDLKDNRLLALSINLSTDIYSGGVFQIRNRYSKKVIHEIKNTGFGDAILFRLRKDLEHKVTNVRSKVSKIAYAGWFRVKPRTNNFTKKQLLKHGSKIKKNYYLPLNNKKSKVTLTDHLKINQAVISRKDGNQVLIFKTDSGSFCLFNPIGSRLWELLNETSDLQETFHTMKDEYHVSPDILKKDILNQVQEFKNIGLVSSIN
ncbi:MAG: 2OG-Fe(II) oxygenase [Candidatus Melainabacteria bacterium]|nr:2OG-Fe(II) oxygenase [Candidatus Melainabacteria bacterium]